MEMMHQVILMMLSAVLTVLIGITAAWARNRWGADVLEDTVFNKESFAYRAIWLAEDFYRGPGKGEQRLAYAVAWASEKLEEQGIVVSQDEIHELIRSLYAEMRDQIHALRDV